MATKLKSVLATLKNQLPLLLKAFLFGALVRTVYLNPAQTGPLVIFLVVAFLLYAQPIFRTFRHLGSLIVLCAVSIFASVVFSVNISPTLVALIFAVLFYLLLGIKTMRLTRRTEWYLLFQITLFYILSVLFFASDKGESFVYKLIGMFFVSWFLLRDYYRTIDRPLTLEVRTVSLVLSVLIVQALWMISILPFSFFVSAGLILMVFFVLQEISRFYLAKQLTSKMLFSYVFALLVVFGVTFALVQLHY